MTSRHPAGFATLGGHLGPGGDQEQVHPRYPVCVVASLWACGLPTSAAGYEALANVTFTWGSSGSSIGWTSGGVNALPAPTASMELLTAGGSNLTRWYNPRFATGSDYGPGTGDDCATPLPNYDSISLRKYACRHVDAQLYYTPAYNPVPVEDAGPGAASAGTVTVTDTRMTATLAVVTTTDEPVGATTTTVSGVRISTSPGDGSNGYNLRVDDGSPFGNAWYGITTSGTLTVDLSGQFDETTWTIDGGTVTFSDPGFACQQGGFGGDARGTVCTPGLATAGWFEADGRHLSWGMAKQGSPVGPIEVRDSTGTTTLAVLGGVVASLSVDAGGNITTNHGEFRYAVGSAGGGCPDHVRWGGDTDPRPATTAIGIDCGTLGVGDLEITGTPSCDIAGGLLTFPTLIGVPASTTVTSSAYTVTALGCGPGPGPWPISVQGDPSSSYSVNGEAFTSVPGTVATGDQVRVRHTSAATPGASVDTTVVIAGVAGTFTSITADPDDADADGVPYAVDNCTAIPNPDQRDSNSDGYGDACDADLDGDGNVYFEDVSIFRQRLNSADPEADFDHSGRVTARDYVVLRNAFGKPPGPSGLVTPP
jgi:hypothetical protein